MGFTILGWVGSKFCGESIRDLRQSRTWVLRPGGPKPMAGDAGTHCIAVTELAGNKVVWIRKRTVTTDESTRSRGRGRVRDKRLELNTDFRVLEYLIFSRPCPAVLISF